MKSLILIIALSALAGVGAYRVFVDLRTVRMSDVATLVQTRTTEEFNKPSAL